MDGNFWNPNKNFCYFNMANRIPVIDVIISHQSLASKGIHFVVPTWFYYNRLGKHPSPLSNTTLETDRYSTGGIWYKCRHGINILQSRQNGCHFADAICEWMFLNESCILIQMPSLSLRIHLTTRRSENDDTPQPLDQWTNSPFIGQQVGNWSICHALWPIRKPIVHLRLYPTHISFIPSQSKFPFLKYGY